MKLDASNITIDSSAKFTTESFDFGDKRIIMQILRGKIYSNPIKTILQEIGCNARDAHREIGKSDIPIKIKLPTKLDETFYIQDYGPGITPDRMSNVFIKYGNSTKRDSNEQTGGFGLGAKTPFAYVDLFNVTTISEEDGKHVKRVYVAYIDETEVGAMACTSKKETTECTGTTISFTPKKTDYYKFSSYTEEVFQFWAVKPEVISDAEVGWDEDEKPLLSTPKWDFYGPNNEDYVILDEIAYPIKWEEVRGHKNLENNGIVLRFNTGDIKITANREQIEWVDESIEAIKKALKPIQKKLKEHAENEIRGCTSYLEAVLKWYGTVVRSYPVRDDALPAWNGIPISPSVTLKDGYSETYEMTKWDGKVKLQRVYTDRYHKNTRSGSITLSDKAVIVLNDTNKDTISYPRIKYLLALKEKKQAIIVNFRINKDTGTTEIPVEWPHLDVINLSTLPLPPRKSSGGGGSAGSIISKVKIIEPSSAKKEWEVANVDFTNGIGIYVMLKGTSVFLKEQHTLSKSEMIELKHQIHSAKHAGLIDEKTPIEIYGVRKQFINKLGSGWIHALDILKKFKVYLEDKSKDYTYIESPCDTYHSQTGNVVIDIGKKKLLPDNHIISEWVRAFSESEKLSNYKALLRDCNDLLEYSGVKIVKKKVARKVARKTTKTSSSYPSIVTEKYPLFALIEARYYSRQSTIVKELLRYIRMVDNEISQPLTNP